MSFLAWIDFDQSDRDRTRRIMDLLSEEDSRDELGIGAVRDALSDLLFPGTSTIQTRLRCMLFVPWIYRIASQETGSAASRAGITRTHEIALIDALEAWRRDRRRDRLGRPRRVEAAAEGCLSESGASTEPATPTSSSPRARRRPAAAGRPAFPSPTRPSSIPRTSG